jgi:glycosyltransferase involved in cell wall biosynthesis
MALSSDGNIEGTARPIVLAFLRHYLPGSRAGGPIRTIANMVRRMHGEFAFRIVTLDRDLGDARPFADMEPGRWLPVGGAEVRYLASAEMTLGRLRRLLRDTPHDVVYLNSFFDVRFTTLLLLLRRFGAVRAPVVLAPRGEFSEGAIAIKRHRKRAFLRLSRALGLYDGVLWQASSELEAADIRREVGNAAVRIHVALDLASPAAIRALPEPVARAAGAPLEVCFLSRLSPKKNLLGALDILQRVSVPVRFTVYGPEEDRDYAAACRARARALPAHVECRFAGHVDADDVVHALAAHDLFFFPTLGENFGHVIHEALRAGLPVLISDRTPWRGLEAQGVGWDEPLDDAGAFVQRIEEVAGWDAPRRARARHAAVTLAEDVACDDGTLQANLSLFHAAIGERVRKDNGMAARTR